MSDYSDGIKNNILRGSHFSIYEPIFDLIGSECVYLGELFGLSHDDAKKLYELELSLGFFDED